MKPILILALLIFFRSNLYSQSKIDLLVKEGVDLHDRGYFEEAMVKYDSALLLEPSSFLASYEKGYTLMAMKRYNDVVALCKTMLATNKSSKPLSEVYILYGNALDLLNKSQESVKVYEEGIKAYPTISLLYFNKAISLNNLGETDKSIEAFKNALVHNPLHASSHYQLANFHERSNRIFMLMSSLTCLLIEPEGDRAKRNMKRIKELLATEAEKIGENSYNINLDAGMLLNTKNKGEDNFSATEMIVTLSSALNVQEKNVKESLPERIQRNLGTMISSLKEGLKEGKGFGWKFYVPFFSDLKDKGHLEVVSHLALVMDDQTENNKWLSTNKEKVTQFYDWIKAYKWPKTQW